MNSDCASDVCDTGVCIAIPECDDGEINGDESDVDCGGVDCDPCIDGQTCVLPTDCVSRSCDGGLCRTTCDDDVLNGDEADVDCGGIDCDGCPLGHVCRTTDDCDTGECVTELCRATCTDGALDGFETGVDCGGGTCPPCESGQTCSRSLDCESRRCVETVCAAPTCDDELQNGLEVGVDCGGGCPGCPAGTPCTIPGDCASDFCRDFVCASLCENGRLDDDESDVDCGGVCPPCGVGGACDVPPDCETGVCIEDRCAVGSCTDGVRNGDEVAPDCGGRCGGGSCVECAVDHTIVDLRAYEASATLWSFVEVPSGRPTSASAYEPSCRDDISTPERLFTFVAPGDGSYLITTDVGALDGESRAFDTVLMVYDGCAGGAIELDCNEDGPDAGEFSTVTMELVSGQLIYLIVDGFPAFNLNVAFGIEVQRL